MKYLSPLIFLFTFHISNGQVIAAYSGTEIPTTVAIAGVSATELSAGSGLTVRATSIFEYQKWTASSTLEATDYFEWSLTADSNFTANITIINISYTAGNKAPRALELKTSLDNYTTTVFLTTINQDSTGTLSIPTSLATTGGGTITFRLFGYNSTNGNASRFGINGGLNTQIGLTNTGISLEGTISYNGLFYDGVSWTPYAPDNTTGTENAIAASGSYTFNSDTQINNLLIMPAGTLIIKESFGIEVNGDLTVDGTLELDSDSNEYSSLIVDGTVSGDVVYKRHVNNTAAVGEDDANDLIAPPVSGEAFNDFLINNANIVSNTSNTLYLFGPLNKTTGAYVTYSNTETATLDAGTGYRAASTDAGSFTFTGTVNTGTITKSISNSGPVFQKWNLIGNPYPSFIELSDFLSSNNTQFDPLSAGIYGYDGDASNGWTIWNQAYSDANPNALITPGQGFLVASKTGGGTITFNSIMRSIGNSDDFILGRSSNEVTSSRIKLLMTNGTKSYATDFYFNPNASRGLDVGYDASIFDNIAPEFSIYSHLLENNDGIAMAIQSLAETDYDNVSIPLGVNSNQGEQLTFNIANNSLPSSVVIYLDDNIANTSTPLNSGDYTITPSADLNGTGRFYLSITNSALSTTENTLYSLNIYSNQKDKTVVIAGQLLETTTVNIYDLQRRIITTATLQATNRSRAIDVSNLTAGVYVVQLVNGTINKTQKIILH